MMSDYESGDDSHFEEVTIPPLDAQQHTEVWRSDSSPKCLDFKET
jgi:hypothetical protein